MAENDIPPIIQLFLNFYSGIEEGVKDDLTKIHAAFIENPATLLELDEKDFADPDVLEVIRELKGVVADSKDPTKALAEWFASKFHDVEAMWGCVPDWLNTVVVPDAQRGQKVAYGRSNQREAYTDKRKPEWEAYAPWLDQYFIRNPEHSLTDGKRACASHFGCSLKTIQRHTMGYKKPSE